MSNPVPRRTIDQSAGGKLRDLNPEESWAILEDLALYDNESWNDPRDFAKSVKAITLPQDVPSTSDHRLIELENQNCMEIPEQAFVECASSHINKMGSKRSEEIKEKGQKEDGMETNIEVEEVIKEEESEFETDEEVEGIFDDEEEDEGDERFNLFPTIKELSHHKWLLKHPRPPWVKVKVKAKSPNNIKISCMIGNIFKRHAYIDLESPITIMSRHQHNKIMTYGIRSRQNPSKPNKISNFVGRVKHIKNFIGSLTYKCDFMILEDTSSTIDRHLEEMVFRKPFIDETGLVYSKENKTVMFKQGDEKITLKIPYTIEIFKKIPLKVCCILPAHNRCCSLIKVSVGCQKLGHLAAMLGCAKTKVVTWDDLTFKLITLGWNVKHEIFCKNVDP
nr:protein kinase-like domain, concanavalin A-like lectin/glucanase domain protein [Tanacetum cinerariifolium]